MIAVRTQDLFFFEDMTMASDKVVAVSSESFDNDVLNSEVPVLVDFWASW